MDVVNGRVFLKMMGEISSGIVYPFQLLSLRSSRIGDDLLSYESKSTDKREQINWRAEKNWTGTQSSL